MKRLAAALAVVVVTATSAVATNTATTTTSDRDVAGMVDPFFGTGPGFSYPGPVTPFGMVAASPDTEGKTSPFAYTGYLYSDSTIRGFSLLHINGAGVHMGGEFPFLPVTAPVMSSDPTSYAVPFSHAAESARPGAYDVTLANGVHVDLATTTHAALERYAFPPALPASVIVEPGRDNTGFHVAQVQAIGDHTVVGMFHGDFDAWFAAKFSQPFTATAAVANCTPDWPNTNCTPVDGVRQASGPAATMVLSFAPGSTVTMRAGVSFVDAAGALRNLRTELKDFDVQRVQTAS